MSPQRLPRLTLPVLGILTEPHHERDGDAFGPLTTFIRDVVEAARMVGRPAYVFSSRDVLRQRTMVWGWSRTNGRWSRDFFPVPRIVYSQLTRPTRQDLEILRWLREHEGSLCVNHPDLDAIVLDLWRLLHIAMSHPTVSRDIPEPVLLKANQSLEQLLSDGRTYVVRPRFRGHGQPAICLMESPQGELSLVTHRDAPDGTQVFHSSVALRAHLEQRYGEVILQPFEEPLRYHRHPILVRSIWQRNGLRQWQESAAVARIGSAGAMAGQFTTVSELDRFQPILQELLGRRLHSTLYQVKTLGGAIARLLHERSHGAGELAVDCWLTATGGVRLYDVTTAGGGLAVRQLRQPTAKQRMIETMLAYVRSLEDVLPAATALEVQSVGGSQVLQG
ncbi:hypothetical protein HY375_00865 [Candidatus Berkelbacteria bacterium]|nr:hypothetical protein [Candidatus Berkelbacteria bacterium]